MIIDQNIVILIGWVLANLMTFVGVAFLGENLETKGNPIIAIFMIAFFFLPMLLLLTKKGN